VNELERAIAWAVNNTAKAARDRLRAGEDPVALKQAFKNVAVTEIGKSARVSEIMASQNGGEFALDFDAMFADVVKASRTDDDQSDARPMGDPRERGVTQIIHDFAPGVVTHEVIFRTEPLHLDVQVHGDGDGGSGAKVKTIEYEQDSGRVSRIVEYPAGAPPAEVGTGRPVEIQGGGVMYDPKDYKEN
jgi:hypothetical protein